MFEYQCWWGIFPASLSFFLPPDSYRERGTLISQNHEIFFLSHSNTSSIN